MVTLHIDAAHACIRLHWADGDVGCFPFLWLRDNCPSGVHPQAGERTFDLLSVSAGIAPVTASLDGQDLTIVWNEEGHCSRFVLDWLRAYRPGRRAHDPAAIPPQLWRGDMTSSQLPRAQADALMHDDTALQAWLCAAKRTGLALVDGLEDDPEAGMRVARRVGFLRETNFGTTFDVESKLEPNNLAYTAERLPLHTDLPNQEVPPGFQFLHCLTNTATGGGSLFCDGFAIAEDLRVSDPEAYACLANVDIPLRFHDRDYDIRRHDRVIVTRSDATISEIRFNAHIAGVFDMPPETMQAYYRAYRAYMAATRSDRYVVSLRLTGGQMVVFDNRRVLHGRGAFDPSTGLRRLRGCYVDRGEWDSRIRVLTRTVGRERSA